MIRTATVACGLVLSLATCGYSQTLTQRIEACRITKGPLAGAYLQNPKAAGFLWYFTSIGVHALAMDNKHDPHVRAYLDRYLNAAMLPGGAVDDVHDQTKTRIVWKVSDSDDSYAGAILSLACWYSLRPGGEAWFKARLSKLKLIATANLVDTIDPVLKLTYTFNSQPERFKLRGEEKAPYQGVCQLMDNCEAYRGVKDFADRLTKLNDPDAAKFATAAATIAQGIVGMFDPMKKAFQVSTLPPIGTFYPEKLIQVAPQVYGVDLGMNTQAMYDDAWNYLNSDNDSWWELKIEDKSNQGAPLMILAYAAALRGDTVKARTHMSYFQNMLSQPSTRPDFGDIQELGWALRTSYLLR